jgi:hypothetical protein
MVYFCLEVKDGDGPFCGTFFILPCEDRVFNPRFPVDDYLQYCAEGLYSEITFSGGQ